MDQSSENIGYDVEEESQNQNLDNESFFVEELTEEVSKFEDDEKVEDAGDMGYDDPADGDQEEDDDVIPDGEEEDGEEEDVKEEVVEDDDFLGTESIDESNFIEDIADAESKLSKYAQWKIDHEKMLAEKRLKAQEDKVKRIEEMKNKLKEFFKTREEQIAKAVRANEEAETLFIEERDAEIEGKEWLRTFSLLGLGTAEAATTGNKDVSRMKSVFFQLKGEISGSR